MKHLLVYNPDYLRILQEFEKALFTKGYATSYMHVSNAREFVFFLESKGISDIRTVKAIDIISYYEYLKERPNQRREGGLSNSYLKHQLFALRLLFDYLTDTKQVEGSPARLPKFSIGKSQEREILTVEEIIQVFECCKDKRERAILSLAYGCGLRRSEIKELNLMDVQLSKGMLVVRDGKNHRSRTIPVSNSVAKELREYVLYERTNYLKEDIVTHAFIVSDTGQRMTGQYLNDNVRAVMKRTDIKKHITLHCLRHSIATHMLDKGADIEFVKNFLGHISIDTSHIYSKRRKQRLNLKNQILA